MLLRCVNRGNSEKYIAISQGRSSDTFEWVTAYIFGLTKEHSFVDGNKQTAIVARLTFLCLNAKDIEKVLA